MTRTHQVKGRAKIKPFRLDVEAVKKDIERDVTEKLKEAVRAYLRAILFNVIPVWSGASVATFIKLAAQVDQQVTISPRVRSRIGLGSNLSEGRLEINMGTGIIKAVYSTSLPHLIFNEFNDASSVGIRLRQPGPYDFQGKGSQAFLQVASKVKLPNPFRRLKKI
jgi:hypothetical protein